MDEKTIELTEEQVLGLIAAFENPSDFQTAVTLQFLTWKIEEDYIK